VIIKRFKNMKYLEIILQFLISLARIIFPQRKKNDDGQCTPANPLPDPPLPALPVERRDGGDAGRSWGDPFPPVAEGGEDADSTLRPLSPAASSDDHAGREDPGRRQLALRETFPKTDWLGLSGYTLMLAGAAACVLKAL